MLIQPVKNKKILVLVANPDDTTQLALPEEIDQLKQSLTSLGQDRFQLEWEINVKEEDWLKHISRVKPQIVHFCGHGTKTGLIVHGDGDKKSEKSKELSNQYLANLFKEFSDRVECVVLNACDTEPLAIALTQHINFAIGMNRPVKDKYAIPFAKYFYNQLGIGESVETAFNLAINEVFRISSPDNSNYSSDDDDRKLAVVGEDGSPVKHQTPDYSIPVLKINPNPIEIKSLWLSPEQEKEAIAQLLEAIADSFKTISLFHAKAPIVLQDQYVPIQVTLERRYQHTVETIGGYAESEAELKRIYAMKGSSEEEVKEEIKRQQVDWQTARGQEHRIVVLADPGMGKSTLLRIEVCRTVQESYQALAAGQHEAIAIPLLIRLSTLADRVTELSTEDAILKIIQERHSQLLINHDNAEMGAFLNEFLRKQLLSGKCLLLLDALDEVPLEKRPRLLEKLNDFVRSYPTCAIVATSRIVGYGGRLVDGAKDMEIVPFTQPQTEQYIETWFKNAQKFLKDESVSARGLIQALRERPQLAGLAQNPLLLSLICSLYQRDQLTLPAQRSQIYQLAVTYMLGGWNRDNLRQGSDEAQVESKTELLEELAYQFSCQEAETFSIRELRRRIKDYLRRDNATDLDDKTNRLIKELSEEDGILQKLSSEGEQYIFLHRTFQEYLTACYLAQAIDVIELVKAHLWEYNWHETLTLLAGLLKEPIFLLEAILSQKDDIFQTLLLLAGRCIAECGEISNPLISEVVSRISRTWKRYSKLAFVKITVARLAQFNFQLFDELLMVLNSKNFQLADDTAEIIVQINRREAVPVLTNILRDHNQDQYIQLQAVLSLERIGSSEALEVLVNALNHKHPVVRDEVAMALARLDRPEGLATLIQDLNFNGSWKAANALQEIGTSEAIESLIHSLNEGRAAILAAEALSNIGRNEGITFLIDAVNSGYFKWREALILGKFGNPEAFQTLVYIFSYMNDIQDWAQQKPCDQNSKEFREWYSKKRPYDPFGILKYLRDKAGNDYESHRSRILVDAINALGKIDNSGSILVLINALKDHNLSVRKAAVRMLGEKCAAEAVTALVETFKYETTKDILEEIPYALEKIGTDEAIEALVEALNQIDRVGTIEAAEILGKMGHPESIPVLIKGLKHKNDFVRVDSANALTRLDRTDGMAILLDALKSEHITLKNRALRSLSRIGISETLEKIVQDSEIDIYDDDILTLARNLAIRFSKSGSPCIPVYPELLSTHTTTDRAEA